MTRYESLLLKRTFVTCEECPLPSTKAAWASSVRAGARRATCVSKTGAGMSAARAGHAYPMFEARIVEDTQAATLISCGEQVLRIRPVDRVDIRVAILRLAPNALHRPAQWARPSRPIHVLHRRGRRVLCAIDRVVCGERRTGARAGVRAVPCKRRAGRRRGQGARYSQKSSSYPPQLLCSVALSTEKSMSVINLLCLVHIARTLKLLLTS